MNALQKDHEANILDALAYQNLLNESEVSDEKVTGYEN